MIANRSEARELVKQIVKERLADKVGVHNIVYFGEEITVTRSEDGAIRFNLPRLRKSFVFMSGRLYERKHVNDDPKPTRVDHQQSPMTTQFSYKGTVEEVDTRIFSNKLVCPCGNVRWVKNADLFQVKKCKPCTFKDRNARRRKGIIK